MRRLNRWGGAVTALTLAVTAAYGAAAAESKPVEAIADAATAVTVSRRVEGAVDASGLPIDVAAAADRWRGVHYLLLGEIHDNPEHHRLRAALLQALLADGVPTWVVFEQIDRQHNAAVAAAPRNTEAVVTAGQLDRKGWAWPLHQPLFDAALAGGAVVVGGNLGRAEASAVVRGGAAQAPLDLQAFLTPPTEDSGAVGSGWTADQQAELTRQVDDGHCGALPAAMFAPMVLAQRARDAALASAMLKAPPGVRVVLIAGNGHVRRDVGVPHDLGIVERAASRTPGIVSIGMLERADDGSMAADAPYDEAWFTTRVARPDPCAAFRPPIAPKAPG